METFDNLWRVLSYYHSRVCGSGYGTFLVIANSKKEAIGRARKSFEGHESCFDAEKFSKDATLSEHVIQLTWDE